jgi:hypothetical protein
VRKLVLATVGLIRRIVADLLFALVGVVGFLLFDRAVEIRFLPVVLSLGGTAPAPVLDA